LGQNTARMTETPMQRSEESRAMFAPNVQVFLYL
jgi:hypothetical protein